MQDKAATSPGEAHYDRSVEDYYAKIEANRAPPLPRGVRLAREGAAIGAREGKRETPLLALMFAREQVFKAEQRLLELTGKIAGHQPEPEKSPTAPPLAGGVIWELGQVGNDIMDAIAQIGRAHV